MQPLIAEQEKMFYDLETVPSVSLFFNMSHELQKRFVFTLLYINLFHFHLRSISCGLSELLLQGGLNEGSKHVL